MYNKEYILIINYRIEHLLKTHFSNRVKPADRSEVRQEIITKILSKQLHHTEEKGNLGKWLYRLIQNHLTDNFRKSKKRFVFPFEDLSYLCIPEDEQDFYKEELLVDRMTQYSDLLAREKPIDQQLMRLKYDQKLSYDQIAEILNLEKGVLAMRQKRIKTRLVRDYKPNRRIE